MPDELREFVDERTKKAGFSTPTEYVRHLIRLDLERESQRRLEAALLERIDDQEYSNLTPDDIEDLRSRVRAGRSRG
jgi:Arc/MetJ-type ribon-helix-helix transcriptional regulator